MEDRGQRMPDDMTTRKRTTGQKSDAEDGGQRSGQDHKTTRPRDYETEVRGRKTEDSGQKAEVSDFRTSNTELRTSNGERESKGQRGKSRGNGIARCPVADGC
jgi:hypothetical protein